MSQFKFEGDIEDFSEPQLNLIENVLKNNGFKNNTVKIEVVGKKGDGYVAVVRRILVETENEHFKIIAKIAPKHELSRAAMNTGLVFKNEIIMYTEVLNLYSDIMKSEDLQNEETFRIPKCYGFIDEAPNEIILLEDLQISGFGMLDRFKPLTNASIKLVLKDLAILHSLSYVLKSKNPDKYNEIKGSLVNLWAMMEGIDDVRKWLLQFEDDLISIMNSYKHKNYIKGTLSQLSSIATKLHKYDLVSKHSVIQQGDCWTNNILFRLENEDPVESVMIDYQVSKASSPASDLLYFMFNCTDYKTRHEHYYEWLDYYHTHLGKSLENFGLRVMQVYPRDQLDADLRRHGKLGLILSIVVASAMVRESDEVMDFREGTESQNNNPADAAEALRIINLNEKTIERLKTKVQGCIDSAVEFGFM